MAKRSIPLFVFDLTRRHKLGECDFVACTDVDNGFVAKIDYVKGDVNEVDVNTRIGNCNNGISLRLSILRYTGRNIDPTQVRALLKQAETKYVDLVQKKMDTDSPSVGECIDFLDALIRGNKHYIDEYKGDFEGRNTTIMSLKMLEKCKAYLIEKGQPSQ